MSSPRRRTAARPTSRLTLHARILLLSAIIIAIGASISQVGADETIDFGIAVRSDEAPLLIEAEQALGRQVDVAVSYTHLRAHETEADLVCRLLLEKKK